MDQLSNFISEYLKTCETVQKLNSKTIKAYRIDLSQFHTFMLPLADFTEKSTLNSFLSLLHQKYKPKTVKRKIATLKAFFHYLVYEELLSQNPFEKLNVKFREPQILPRTVPDTIIEIFLRTMYKQKTGTYNISIQFAPSWYSRNRITICNRSTCFWTMLTYSYPNRFHYSQNYYKRERFKRTYFTNWKWRCQRNIIWILYSL